mgnify:CR=1 FL=1
MIGGGFPLAAVGGKAKWMRQLAPTGPVYQAGTLTDTPVQDLADAKACSTALYAQIFHGLLKRGIYIAPSQFECNFISAAHTEKDVDAFLDAFEDVCGEIGASARDGAD